MLNLNKGYFFEGRELRVELQCMCELKLYSLNSSKLLLVRRDREIFYVQDYCLLYVLSYNPHDTVRDIKLKLSNNAHIMSNDTFV